MRVVLHHRRCALEPSALGRSLSPPATLRRWLSLGRDVVLVESNGNDKATGLDGLDQLIQ